MPVSDAIALALRTGSSIWMLEEVVAEASIAVDAEADAWDQSDFNRFVDDLSPAALVPSTCATAVLRTIQTPGQPDPAATSIRDRTAGEPVHPWHHAGPGSVDQMHTVLQAAVLAGINHLETAPAYGPAEEFLGQALKREGRQPDDGWVITSKLLPGLSLSEGKHASC